MIILPRLTPFPHQTEYGKALISALRTGKPANLIFMASRQCGKTLFTLSMFAYLMREFPAISIVHFFPRLKQAKAAVWNNITPFGMRALDVFPREYLKVTERGAKYGKPNEADHSITYKNHSRYTLVGLKEPDDVRGGTYNIICFDEAAYTQEGAFRIAEAIQPANKSILLLLSTPNGRNWFHKLFHKAYGKPDWFIGYFPVDKCFRRDGTRIVTDEEIEAKLNNGTPKEWIDQEFRLSWNSPRGGAVYGTAMEQVRLEKRGGEKECYFPYDYRYPVNTVWDLGWLDHTIVIFYQRIDSKIRIIDCIDTHHTALVDVMQQVVSRRCPRTGEQFKFNIHNMPVDSKVHELLFGYKRISIAQSFGMYCRALQKVKSKTDAINHLRVGLKDMYFDAYASHVVDALEAERYDYDEDKRNYGDSIADLWSNDICDAMTYLAEVECDKSYQFVRKIVDSSGEHVYNTYTNKEIPRLGLKTGEEILHERKTNDQFEIISVNKATGEVTIGWNSESNSWRNA